MSVAAPSRPQLDQASLLKLRRFNTPAVYNGWEQITARDASREGISREPITDFMPEMGPMVGYAVTVVIEPSNPEHPRKNPDAWPSYWRYVSEQPGSKILVVQDLDRPHAFGACVGEVNSSIMRAIGCVGAIVDGAIRDLDEMRGAGFKALARQLAVGHAHGCPVRWGLNRCVTEGLLAGGYIPRVVYLRSLPPSTGRSAHGRCPLRVSPAAPPPASCRPGTTPPL